MGGIWQSSTCALSWLLQSLAPVLPRLSETLNKARCPRTCIQGFSLCRCAPLSAIGRCEVAHTQQPSPNTGVWGGESLEGGGRGRQERKTGTSSQQAGGGRSKPPAVFVFLSPRDSEREHGHGNTEPLSGAFVGRLHNSKANLCPSPPAGYRVLLQVCSQPSLLPTWYRHLRPCTERARQGRTRPKRKESSNVAV